MKNLFLTAAILLTATISAFGQTFILNTTAVVKLNYTTHAVLEVIEKPGTINISMDTRMVNVPDYYGNPLVLSIKDVGYENGDPVFHCLDSYLNKYKIVLDTDTALAIHDYTRNLSSAIRYSTGEIKK
jgi:hypothetical protein